ncbi:MAG: lysylphosphatidylglycerol synthase transmembrane domain-containing protein, partial [Dehalococcoidia bacterium]
MLGRRRVWFGVAVTGGFLALLFAQLDLSDMRDALAGANYVYLAPGVAVYFVSLYFRSYRWRFLLKPFVETRATQLYPVVLVGYMANNLLPLRLGELVRSYYLSTRVQARGSTALATIVIERVLDGLVLLFLLALAALFLPVSGLADHVSTEAAVPLW